MAYLQLNRLVILKQGKSVYDEKFHNGVNIIRGENGVGKSTIANSIYYLLGGDYNKWLPEIEKCDFIVGELDLNEKIITVRRSIELERNVFFILLSPDWTHTSAYASRRLSGETARSR